MGVGTLARVVVVGVSTCGSRSKSSSMRSASESRSSNMSTSRVVV